MASRVLRSMSLVSLPLALALVACGSNKDANNLAELDAALTNDASDPALRGALEGPLATDPDLAGQSNARALKPGEKPLSAAIPITKANIAAASAEARKLAGGALQSAPAPTEGKPCAECSAGGPKTLGALAREQGGKSCGTMAYGMDWAQRLPAGLPLYPGANLMEAAGVDGGRCGLRAASFIAPATLQDAVDFYYTMARRAGYDAEHQTMDGDHVLGGTRAKDDGAYFITFAPAPGGGTAVDIVTNNGR